MRNTTSSVLPISADKPANPVAPKMSETRASTKKIIAARNTGKLLLNSYWFRWFDTKNSKNTPLYLILRRSSTENAI